MITLTTWVALSGFSTSSTYPLLAHSLTPCLPACLPACLDKSEYVQHGPSRADATSRSLHRPSVRVLIPTSLLAGCRPGGCGNCCIPHARTLHALQRAGGLGAEILLVVGWGLGWFQYAWNG